MSGSAATSSTGKPAGTVIAAIASWGESAGPGAFDWPCGMCGAAPRPWPTSNWRQGPQCTTNKPKG